MSLATLLSILIGAVLLPILKTPLIPSIIYGLCVLFVIYRHKENIKRLFKGEESKTYFFKYAGFSAPCNVIHEYSECINRLKIKDSDAIMYLGAIWDYLRQEIKTDYGYYKNEKTDKK